jgi:hypothetical protein
MLKNLLGGKKKGDFYLQIDESEETATTETAAPVEASAETSATTTDEVATTETPTETPAPVAVKVPEAEVPFWVTAMRSTEEIMKAEAKSEMTFSTDYLLSSGSSSRRRPGPSLNAFKEIARQVKKPIS